MGEVFHDYLHHRDISVKKMREGENGIFVILVSSFEIWFIIAQIKVSLFKPFFSHLGIPVTAKMALVDMVKVTPARVTCLS